MVEQERSFKGGDAVRFLKHLMRQIEGKLLVVFWDGSPIHRGRASKVFWRAWRPRGCNSNNCPAMPRISTLRKVSGST
jgi:hypothetical protein